MIVKYNERLFKYFKALAADIFCRKKKDALFASWRYGRDLLRDIRSAISIEFLVKIDALIFAGQKRQLEIITYEDKAFTLCTIWHVNLHTRVFIGL